MDRDLSEFNKKAFMSVTKELKQIKEELVSIASKLEGFERAPGSKRFRDSKLANQEPVKAYLVNTGFEDFEDFAGGCILCS